MKPTITPEMLLDRNGNPVRVQRIPMSTGKSKFKRSTAALNEVSPFERFAKSNNAKGRQYSF